MKYHGFGVFFLHWLSRPNATQAQQQALRVTCKTGNFRRLNNTHRLFFAACHRGSLLVRCRGAAGHRLGDVQGCLNGGASRGRATYSVDIAGGTCSAGSSGTQQGHSRLRQVVSDSHRSMLLAPNLQRGPRLAILLTPKQSGLSALAGQSIRCMPATETETARAGQQKGLWGVPTQHSRPQQTVHSLLASNSIILHSLTKVLAASGSGVNQGCNQRSTGGVI